MKPNTEDLACFSKTANGKLDGTIGMHVYDFIEIGNGQFIEDSKPAAQCFESKTRTFDNITFAELSIGKQGKGYSIHQQLYTSRLKEAALDCTFEIFRARKHELAYTTHTRLALYAAVARMSQISTQTFNREAVKLLNKTIKQVTHGHLKDPTHHIFNIGTLEIMTYADSSYANIDDLSTQVEYAILLADDANRLDWISFRNYKCRRIIRSVLGKETYAFVDCFGMAFSLTHDISKVIGRKLSLLILAYFESLFQTLVKSIIITKRRLMIYIKAAYQEYKRDENITTGWVRSKKTVANGLTKRDACESLKAALRNEKTELMKNDGLKELNLR